jgi:16S rRNA (cytidine1402-2'-O)-methyltransferase
VVSGLLVLAATPIGSSDDASPRLRTELANADIIAAEDTRRLRALMERLGVQSRARILPYFDANESARAAELVDALLNGARIVVATDAGMPSVSDPGYRLVAAAIEAGVRVTAAPGPSAVLTALAVSGLPVDRFCFEGFLPRKAGERTRRLAELAGEQRTMVFFEAPHRTEDALRALAAVFGDERAGVVCRELTKTYEEIVRGTLAELSRWAAEGVRGEVTLVVAGAPAGGGDLAAAAAEVAELAASGVRLKVAVADVAERRGVAKNALYAEALKLRA